MLKTRVLAAGFALPIAFAAIIWLPSIYFAVLMGMLILLGAWEWAFLAGFNASKSRVIYVVLVLLGLFASVFLPAFWILNVALLVWLWILLAILYYEKNASSVGLHYRFVRGLVGFIILIAAWVSMVTMQASVQWASPNSLILMLCIVWAADTGAFFVRKRFGQRALAARVSPKKTWEGFFGGMASSFFVAIIGGIFLTHSWQSYVGLLLLAIVTAFFSVIGDLGVSLFKRMSDVKDSGHFLPGHGGLLDRLDSVAAASVIFTLGTLFVGF
ncbi:MAG TPA: phosphatidate cytidylyltransferase [Coxiellaceae bacterium]|nr:phosphatidate cytidylyltransferase [Coxiellaceae bacterium]